MRKSLSVSIPAELKAELDRFTEAEGVSRSDLVREALREYLFAWRFRALRRELIPYAEAQGICTDEDVFRRLSSSSPWECA
ncbi:MAG: CopG family ribbon-helix-helix protein [Longimicrobiaceae bacterium]